MRITRAERAMMVPGTCTRCGTYSTLDRNSAGECTDCHNQGAHEWQAVLAARREQKRAEGRAYWEGRGIQVGQRVKTVAVNRLWQTRHEVYGVAKVGAVGAYVKSEFQAGYLAPDGWQAT